MKPDFKSVTDKHGYQYQFACIPIDKINEVKLSKAELDYTFALVTIQNNEIVGRQLIGKITLLADLPEKIEEEINELNPTHLLLYHAYADFYIIDKDKLADFDFGKIWY